MQQCGIVFMAMILIGAQLMKETGSGKQPFLTND